MQIVTSTLYSQQQLDDDTATQHASNTATRATATEEATATAIATSTTTTKTLAATAKATTKVTATAAARQGTAQSHSIPPPCDYSKQVLPHLLSNTAQPQKKEQLDSPTAGVATATATAEATETPTEIASVRQPQQQQRKRKKLQKQVTATAKVPATSATQHSTWPSSPPLSLSSPLLLFTCLYICEAKVTVLTATELMQITK